MDIRVAGVDLGKSAAKFVILRLSDNGGGPRIELSECVPHEGNPLGVFSGWYARNDVAACQAVGATGLHADEIASPVLTGLPEDACLEAALRFRSDLEGPLNIVSVGARGYAALTRNQRGRVQFFENDKCSSGTGETMVKSAARFGLSLIDADRIASEAADSIPITARCSVFAKSEMTHFGNQGRPVDQIFRGYFDSIARHVAALLARGRVDGPIYLIGGTSRLRTLRRCLEGHLGCDVRVPEGAQAFEALGAAQIAAEQMRAEGAATLPRDAAALVRRRAHRFEILPPAERFKHLVRVLEAPPVPHGASSKPSILGLDLGSTGSKATLTSIHSGEIVLNVYDRTRGNPVGAAQRLVKTILERATPDVRAIGVTGSGREAAATVLRAAYPELEDFIVVVNEIVAHATAAIRCDTDCGRSLSVVEIGGQDAKFIQVRDGHIVESDMNKACSAGTGSFLEEQAILYGVHEIEEFTRLARQATRPPNLGQMCTVFVAEAAADAHNEGFGIPDLFGGFQYAVIHNYKNRVMGQRSFGERIFFQGKPASGPALAWTLAAVTGREVVVPPDPGAMGAWGIGLCALKDIGREALGRTRAFDLAAFLTAGVAERDEIRCKDPRCATLCAIERTTVSVAGTRQVVYSGGACPKFEISSRRPKLPREAPSAFDEREELIETYAAGRPGPGRIGVAQTGCLAGYLPWAVTFLSELGLGVRVLRPDARSLSRGEERCYAYDACAPVKVAHGVMDTDVDLIFAPKILDVPDRDGPGGKTCSSNQGAPHMVEQALRARGRDVTLLKPAVPLLRGPADPLALRELRAAASSMGADPSRVKAAARRAAEAQADHERELANIGRRTLAYGRATGIPVVVVSGSLHVIFDPVINAGIPAILRQNGVLALPMDCYPIPAEIDPLPRASWADANRILRVALAARARGDAYPLMLSSFGCGPGSFIEQIFGMLMDGYPHTALESDGHGGTAGYVTRIQSFLHGVRAHDGRPSPAPEARVRLLRPLEKRPLEEDRDARLVTLSIGDRLASLSAASYRSLGFDSVPSGPTSASALTLGRRDCSGKECLAYQLIWGSFREHIEKNGSDKRTVLLQVTGQGACRNCMFSIKDQMTLSRMGLEGKVSIRHLGSEIDVRASFLDRFWRASLAWDILNQHAAYHRPIERRVGQVDEIHKRYCDDLEHLIERRQGSGLGGALAQRRFKAHLLDLVTDASREYAALARHGAAPDSLRTVFLTGDIYVRLDEFASDGLVRRLNARGLRVIVDPLCTFVEYLSNQGSSEILGLPEARVEAMFYRLSMRRARRALYVRARALHPWLPMPSVVEALEEGAHLIDRYPFSETPITVGGTMHAWRSRMCDGIVVVGPWGCGPALVSEGLLRHQREIPMLFLYADGSPVDERRLNGFTYRLRRAAARTAPMGTARAEGGGAPMVIEA